MERPALSEAVVSRLHTYLPLTLSASETASADAIRATAKTFLMEPMVNVSMPRSARMEEATTRTSEQ